MKSIIKIIRHNNMTDIDSKFFTYTAMDDFYTIGDGCMYQGFDGGIKDVRVELLCGEIHDRLKEISVILGDVE